MKKYKAFPCSFPRKRNKWEETQNFEQKVHNNINGGGQAPARDLSGVSWASLKGRKAKVTSYGSANHRKKSGGPVKKWNGVKDSTGPSKMVWGGGRNEESGWDFLM